MEDCKRCTRLKNGSCPHGPEQEIEMPSPCPDLWIPPPEWAWCMDCRTYCPLEGWCSKRKTHMRADEVCSDGKGHTLFVKMKHEWDDPLTREECCSCECPSCEQAPWAQRCAGCMKPLHLHFPGMRPQFVGGYVRGFFFCPECRAEVSGNIESPLPEWMEHLFDDCPHCNGVGMNWTSNQKEPEWHWEDCGDCFGTGQVIKR